MYNKIMKILYNSGIYILVTFACLLIITSIMWLLNVELLWLNFILALLISSIICYKYCNGDIKEKIISLVLALLVLALSILMSGHIYDQSDDGNSYQKEAVYMLKSGWNPLYDNYYEFSEKNEIDSGHSFWIKHYPKTTWIMASTIYDITGNIETGKFYTLLFCYVVFAIIAYIIYEHKKLKIFNILIALIVVANPIVFEQISSYYVDAFMGLLLFLNIFFMVSFIKDDKNKLIKIGLAASIIIITNIKFTGLAYSGLFCLAYYIYYLIIKIKQKDFKILIYNTLYFFNIVLVSVLLVGSTSYVTNTISQKNPFYPLIGKNKVDITSYLQPASFSTMSPIEKNYYSIFSKSADIGVFNGGEPELKIPFTFNRDEIYSLRYDVRIGGYGVLFSGIFIISSILMIGLFTYNLIKKQWNIILYIIPIIITILLAFFMEESWWARYAPQLYLFVIIPLVLLTNYKNLIAKIFFILFSILVFINSVICFIPYYTSHLPLSGMSRINLENNRNKEIIVFLAAPRFTGIYANLKDYNINYQISKEMLPNMKQLYGYYAYYIVNENKED